MKKSVLVIILLLLFLTACQDQAHLNEQMNQKDAAPVQTDAQAAVALNQPVNGDTIDVNQPDTEELPPVIVVDPVIELLNYPYAPGESVGFTSNYAPFRLENRDGKWRLMNPQPGFKEEKGDLQIQDYGLIGEKNVEHVFSAPYSDSYLLTILSGRFSALVTCGHASSSMEGESIRGARWTQNSWIIENGEAPLALKIGQNYREDINYNKYRIFLTIPSVSHVEVSWADDRIRVGGPEGEIELQVIEDQGCTMSQPLTLTVGPGSFDLVTDRLDEGVIVLETADGTQELKLDWKPAA